MALVSKLTSDRSAFIQVINFCQSHFIQKLIKPLLYRECIFMLSFSEIWGLLKCLILKQLYICVPTWPLLRVICSHCGHTSLGNPYSSGIQLFKIIVMGIGSFYLFYDVMQTAPSKAVLLGGKARSPEKCRDANGSRRKNWGNTGGWIWVD